jgi:hypothetical protein
MIDVTVATIPDKFSGVKKSDSIFSDTHLQQQYIRTNEQRSVNDKTGPSLPPVGSFFYLKFQLPVQVQKHMRQD